jgi:hypothetical protein
LQKNVNSGPQPIHIENRDRSTVLTADVRLWGQRCQGPSGVASHFTRARSLPTLPPLRKTSTRRPGGRSPADTSSSRTLPLFLTGGPDATKGPVTPMAFAALRASSSRAVGLCG